MKNRQYVNQEIDQINLNESGIIGILWKGENEIDLELIIDWCGQYDLKEEIDFNNISTKLIFEFCHDINFDFKHKPPYTIGALEITEFTYNELPDNGGYLIEFRFDFQPNGYIKFNCSNFRFIVEEK